VRVRLCVLVCDAGRSVVWGAAAVGCVCVCECVCVCQREGECVCVCLFLFGCVLQNALLSKAPLLAVRCERETCVFTCVWDRVCVCVCVCECVCVCVNVCVCV